MRTDSRVSRHRLLLTAPWEPIIVRRGDALGLRGFADLLADSLAPGMSNRVRDGRWVTVLAWCLARSQAVFHASGGRAIETRQQQQERYAWLRPLELMWVARTITLAPEDWEDRPLPGRRRLVAWLKHTPPSDRFGLSEEQFRGYRQTGSYGAYRVAFRHWAGMTAHGDGWTPGPLTNELAKWLDAKLGTAARPAWSLVAAPGSGDGVSTRSTKRSRGGEHDWYLRHWPEFDRFGRGCDEYTLPRPRGEFTLLPEAHLLKQAVFGGNGTWHDSAGDRRRKVALEAARSRASSHLEICEHLASTFTDEPALSVLPTFSRLADAGMAVMDLIADELGDLPGVSLAQVAKRHDAPEKCAELLNSARKWTRGGSFELAHTDTVDRFARAIPSARPIECLRALMHHHEVHGGGLRWFALRNGCVEPRLPPGSRTSRYGFRLWALCRLATQCGVLRKMPRALLIAGSEDSLEAEDD